MGIPAGSIPIPLPSTSAASKINGITLGANPIPLSNTSTASEA